MKKVFALLLALLMAAFVIPACAETLEVVPGTPANCSFSDFQNWFDLSIASSGYDYTFVWDSTPYSEDGFDVYTARMENGPEFKVYTVGGNFCYLIATNSGSFQLSDSSGAKSFGECLGAVLGGGITGLFIPEQGINAFQSQISSFQSDINPLLTILMSGFSSPSQFLMKMWSATSLSC